jgi:GDP-D-mannose 3', 5'-epimerase
LDLRIKERPVKHFKEAHGKFEEVYQLATDIGGMGFIHWLECEILRNSALININMVHASARRNVNR